MKQLSTQARLGSAVLLLCLGIPSAFADTVTMRLVNSPLTLTPWHGENVSPYSAEIKQNGSWANPINLSVVCLDIAENTNLESEILYNRTYNGGGAYDPSLTSPPTMQQRYDGAARLAAELFALPTPTGDARGMRSFAIWYIFNPLALNNHGFAPQMTTDIITMANNAIGASSSVSYTVYTPPSVGTNLRSQRFIGNVTVPEPSAVAVLALDLSGLLGVAVLLGRRFRRSA
jgi:hypothetical protein